MNFSRLILSFYIFGTIILSAIASINNSITTISNPPPVSKGKIIEDPDIPPIFKGGQAEMYRFITNTLRYPADASERNVQGLVVYTFIVEKDGTLTNFDLIHRADSSLNKEALRILQAMPPWRPAKFKDEIVRSKTYVPMYFSLNKNASTVAQKTTTTVATYAKTNTEIANSEVFSIVDKMPQYPYGEKELAGFIGHQIRYPKEARQQGIEGRILCSFIVATDGSISNIEVVQGLDPQLDKEAVRVLSLMSKWIPGEKNGKKVNVKCLLPIDFIIDEDPIPTGV
ncbi:MAG: transport protein TonB [Bacteroidetes bacterium ADurb.BinA174]|nr:MAG: transport protein TonB [Bacteroidetes bacterium ADurb.BinA174]